ncbi:SpaH/EbpB family LPXTG-anchored major pilin [Aquihabitans sp. McL0605]|uniref:SpaH/EbpB family LPXTG-anchored major pilin n=1 Tax=Aquihabitans sp. McL0605 TaxID=3415671 RepID=UPI003CE9236B
MTPFHKKLRRGTLVLSAMLVLGAIGPGVAANAAAIDPTQTGSIIIHKYENPGDGNQNPSGTGTNPSTNPIAGVQFEYCGINGVDILDGTNAGWDAINAITPTQLAAAQTGSTVAGHNLVNCQTVTTDATGTATTPDLPLGPYFVREIAAPPQVIDRATPFIVTLPTPGDGATPGADWVYDVNVYPKNTVAEGPRKNIVRQPTNGVALGAPITYQVTVKIPALATGQTYDKFVMTDTLDTKLDPNTDLTKIIVKAGTTTFVQGTDYTPVWTGQTLTATFTAAGRAKLVAGQNVVLEFEAKANANGVIDNQAFVNLNDFVLTPGQPNGPGGSPTNVVTTRWGGLVVKKVSASSAANPLEGAVFQIYMGTTDQAGCKADIANLTRVTVPTGTGPLEVTSGADGAVVVPGLWVGDTELEVAADGTVTNVSAPGHDFTQRCYVLKETKAPSGYVLPTGAAALTEVLLHSGSNGTVAVPALDIENTVQVAPLLPMTGAAGILTLTGLGLVLVSVGGAMVVSRRRDRLTAA